MDEDIGEEDFLVGLENELEKELMGDEDAEQIQALEQPISEGTPMMNTVNNEHGDEDETLLESDDSTDNEFEETQVEVGGNTVKRTDELAVEERTIEINIDLLEEINALKEKIAEKQRVCEASLNLVMKKKYEDVVKVLKAELLLKIARTK